ncbi:hypothetical protein GGI20_006207 [Coemansia sp. BCRC 34301]|nr:hypothetical protein GGI20_006207 [Coemansia sp. BCRC 34301]
MLRPTSIFYRSPPRSITPPPAKAISIDDDCDEPNVADKPPAASSAKVASKASVPFRDWEAEEKALDELRRQQAAASDLAWSLPFGRCLIAPNTASEPIYSEALSHATRPTVVPPARETNDLVASNFKWPTAEVISHTLEYLYMLRIGDVPLVNISIDRRLSCEKDFIWNIVDHVKADMWLAMACVILLKRYACTQNIVHDAPYGSRHALYLGILMVAAMHTELSDKLDQFSYDNILSIIGPPFTKADLIKYRRDTLVALDHRAWISKPDIEEYARNNQFDIANIHNSAEPYKERERMRAIIRNRERKEKEDMCQLLAYLDRYMHRAPHDSGGSWNKETAYCTESRFLFRHLPWFHGMVNPLYVSARSEKIVEYSSDRKTKPYFSPLLPPLRNRNIK